MALGKLWQAFFGKRPEPREAETALSPQAASASQAEATKQPDPRGVGGEQVAKPSRSHKPKVSVIAPTAALDAGRSQTDSRPAQPKRNAWSPLVAGRTIGSILDTHPGNGDRAVSLLEAIVCRDAPQPKYLAIGQFELAEPALPIRHFHQRVRQVGGMPSPIPGDLLPGLKHLAQTHGPVDLILLDGPAGAEAEPEIRRWLERVSHPSTLVLRLTEQNTWETVQVCQVAPKLSTRSGAVKPSQTRPDRQNGADKQAARAA